MKIYKIEILELNDENLKSKNLPLFSNSFILNDEEEFNRTISWLQQSNNNLYVKATVEKTLDFYDIRDILKNFIKE